MLYDNPMGLILSIYSFAVPYIYIYIYFESLIYFLKKIVFFLCSWIMVISYLFMLIKSNHK